MSTLAKHGRRHFLRTLGGAALALPVLPSLLTPSEARAAAAEKGPRFICMGTQHGGVWGDLMFPGDTMLGEQRELAPGHVMRRGDLQLASKQGKATLSHVLSAPSSRFSPKLAAKLNVLRGFDVPFYIGHHTGGHLGNYARNDGAGGAALLVQGDPRPTIDQVMAWSPTFYSELGSIRERSIHVGGDGKFSISWGHENPLAKSGAIGAIPTSFSAPELFARIFVHGQSQDNPRVRLVDRVIESYRTLRFGTSGDALRLSGADKQRLDAHMDRLGELEQRLMVVATCRETPAPPPLDKKHPGYGGTGSDPEAMRVWQEVFNDVIVAAIICGTTRIATVQSLETWSTYRGDWHQEVAHMSDQPDGVKQHLLADAHQVFFDKAFLDLANKLDVEESEGRTYLDNTLLMWSQESGHDTHNSITVPIITAGSAGGFFRTGQYVDYRNRDNAITRDIPPTAHQFPTPGLLYSQWLSTVLHAMGVPRSEWERSGEKGPTLTYRDPSYASDGAKVWPDRLFAQAGDVAPFLKA